MTPSSAPRVPPRSRRVLPRASAGAARELAQAMPRADALKRLRRSQGSLGRWYSRASDSRGYASSFHSSVTTANPNKSVTATAARAASCLPPKPAPPSVRSSATRSKPAIARGESGDTTSPAAEATTGLGARR